MPTLATLEQDPAHQRLLAAFLAVVRASLLDLNVTRTPSITGM